MSFLIYLFQLIIGLVIILVALSLFGISPFEVGDAVGDAFGSLGRFFQGIRSDE